jgi:hypothetical protein
MSCFGCCPTEHLTVIAALAGGAHLRRRRPIALCRRSAWADTAALVSQYIDHGRPWSLRLEHRVLDLQPIPCSASSSLSFTVLTFVLIYLSAILLLGERLSVPGFCGIMLVLVGLYLLSMQ